MRWACSLLVLNGNPSWKLAWPGLTSSLVESCCYQWISWGASAKYHELMVILSIPHTCPSGSQFPYKDFSNLTILQHILWRNKHKSPGFKLAQTFSEKLLLAPWKLGKSFWPEFRFAYIPVLYTFWLLPQLKIGKVCSCTETTPKLPPSLFLESHLPVVVFITHFFH